MNKCKFEPGIYNISNDEYHSSEGISRSSLMKFKQCPRLFWYEYISGLDKETGTTEALDLGNAVHTLTLEPHNFDKNFHVIHQKTRPRKNSNPYETMIEQAKGRTILTLSEFNQANEMSSTLKINNEISSLLEGCSIEKSIFFKHKETDILCKSRPDAWHNSIVCDLKTTKDASFRSMQNSAITYGYFLQAGMTACALESIGMHLDKFVIIAIEKTKPYLTAIYIMTDEAIQFGITQFNQLMTFYVKCLEKNEWPSYGIQYLPLPNYAKFEQELEF